MLFQLDDDDEVLVIENGGEPLDLPASVSVWRSPWPLGVPAGFNLGVALAANELVFMLGSDDFILEGCMDALRSAWEK
ncbi:MAG: hypothetical protein GTO22_04745, partial [Gemmatimonadales bacterium]|nr:hypothetical protein [Gemmatimonadales bacterium]